MIEYIAHSYWLSTTAMLLALTLFNPVIWILAFVCWFADGWGKDSSAPTGETK